MVVNLMISLISISIFYYPWVALPCNFLRKKIILKKPLAYQLTLNQPVIRPFLKSCNYGKDLESQKLDNFQEAF